MAHRFFIDPSYSGGRSLTEVNGPPWSSAVAAGDALPPEFRYIYDILEHALPAVRSRSLRFYFTKEAYFLPEYGPDVVAVLSQEERTKVPVYGRYVRAVIRNLLSEPALDFRLHRHMGRLEGVLAFEYVRNWYTHLRSRMAQAHPPPYLRHPVREEPAVIRIPLGYHGQVEVPQVTMAERAFDTFFAGQVRHELPAGSYLRFTSTSKFEARAQIWKVLEELDREGRWKLDLGRISATDSGHAEYDSYSTKMMQSRICVSPRGTFAECFRTYEGLRAGCLVVTNRQEPDPFLYPGAPVLMVDHWGELRSILERYARDYDLLEEFRARGLAWWNDHLRPEVIARTVAARLNEAGDTLLYSKAI